MCVHEHMCMQCWYLVRGRSAPMGLLAHAQSADADVCSLAWPEDRLRDPCRGLGGSAEQGQQLSPAAGPGLPAPPGLYMSWLICCMSAHLSA
jgi:hypothetical protein